MFFIRCNIRHQFGYMAASCQVIEFVTGWGAEATLLAAEAAIWISAKFDCRV